jgi:hypothetical protein
MNKNLQAKLEDQSVFNNEVFGNHTNNSIAMMQATHAEVDGGLINHQKQIEESLEGLSSQSDMLGRSIRRMQSLKTDTEREQDIHRKALETPYLPSPVSPHRESRSRIDVFFSHSL